jgi:hypothetical protein
VTYLVDVILVRRRREFLLGFSPDPGCQGASLSEHYLILVWTASNFKDFLVTSEGQVKGMLV